MNIGDLDFEQLLRPLKELEKCCLCPHECGADRFSDKLGFCKSRADFNISSICIHHGEEPPISGSKGICNVFFTNCNMQCVYCQNYQISENRSDRSMASRSLIRVLTEIIEILDQGINILGFVSPGHFIPQMKVIITALHEMGYHPTIVYNSNGYDKAEELKKMEGFVDVFLPDMKYAHELLGQNFSGVKNYPQISQAALQEMYRQKGTILHLNEEDYAEQGLIIRHLVLPGQVQNSKDVLRWIAEDLSPNINISLMSQYYPTARVCNEFDFGRTLKTKEYNDVVDYFYELGLHKGWVQSLDSQDNYRPDFDQEVHPFE
ncbi:MAG: radical SAM protein [Bacteroidetes bacterium]|nr:radical SAM protein [Bacteroidota bacterium]